MGISTSSHLRLAEAGRIITVVFGFALLAACDDSTPCEDVCETEGEVSCFSSTEVATCTKDGACLSWVRTACMMGEYCEPDAAECLPCDEECTAAGETRCEGNQIQTCDAMTLCWGEPADCPTAGQSCDAATNMCAACSDACTDGATQCSGTMIETCEVAASGCLDWSAPAACPMDQECDAATGMCAGCTPQCTGKECGDDGCGGTCGMCGTGFDCNAMGQCDLDPASMWILTVTTGSINMTQESGASWDDANGPPDALVCLTIVAGMEVCTAAVDDDFTPEWNFAFPAAPAMELTGGIRVEFSDQDDMMSVDNICRPANARIPERNFGLGAGAVGCGMDAMGLPLSLFEYTLTPM